MINKGHIHPTEHAKHHFDITSDNYFKFQLSENYMPFWNLHDFKLKSAQIAENAFFNSMGCGPIRTHSSTTHSHHFIEKTFLGSIFSVETHSVKSQGII